MGKELKIMRRIIYKISILFLAVFLTSCEGWLELYPENSQTSDQYWQTKEDVEAVIAAGYVKLQKSIDYLFVWGEIRGNGISIMNATVDDNIKDAQKIREMDILPSNMYSKWDRMYQIINMTNSVIKYAPFVLGRDPSFNEAQMNSFLSEAYFLRSLAYFYLVRTFRDVPFVLHPYVNDEKDYDMAKTNGDEILARLVDDLNKALPAAKTFFPEVDVNNPVRTKGRATKWAIHSLLADIYLWQGEYDKCIANCDSVIQSGRVGLIDGQYWFTNFNPGNSNESIFEIQYNYNQGQTNDIFKWFETNNKYIISNFAFSLFLNTESIGDKRGNGSSYLPSTGKIWKHIGLVPYQSSTAVRSASTQNDNNFIIYRLADIYLMKAEALTMKGQYNDAAQIVDRIRKRAGIVEQMAIESNERAMLNLILNERCREFLAEGKRWFDLLRVARRNNYEYKDYMIGQVTLVVPTNKISIVTSKLTDENSHYMPIHQDELNVNRLLNQNPYYSSLGN